ncbi:hypothetical protein CTheo_6596 [Ceratobasidium theobromae]|uniref:Uncharacterized protein n=1 Tax=Ceratobasidium theobromae TaxID=1582974 RepID=A0A5N5QES7_9AGAM|nr:hypothetical protein CTheo_6596 [Ceratobasidium theobromae]
MTHAESWGAEKPAAKARAKNSITPEEPEVPVPAKNKPRPRPKVKNPASVQPTPENTTTRKAKEELIDTVEPSTSKPITRNTRSKAKAANAK